MRVGLFLLVALLACPALAHDTWVVSEGSGLRVLLGHPEEGPEPFEAEKLTYVRAMDDSGRTLAVERLPDAAGVALKSSARPALVLVEIDNGYYTKTEDSGKFRPGVAADFAKPTETKRFLKAGKSLLAWSPNASRPKGQPLELVPLTDPRNLGAEETLGLQVLYQGQPLPGAAVTRALPAGTPFETRADAQGVAQLPYSPGMEQLYTTRHSAPDPDPEVKSRDWAAALFLNLPQ